MLASYCPSLDKDAPKIDSDPNSFKSISIDRSSFHQLGESSRLILCALSLQDWFIGLAGLHISDSALYETYADAVAVRCATFATEVTLQQHASLLLMERDAWLERPSVQLSNELKQTARLAPFDSQYLFWRYFGRISQIISRRQAD